MEIRSERVMTSAATIAIVASILGLAQAAYVCEKPSDVVFLLDTSNSIWQPDFKKQLRFVRAIINEFTVGEDNMRVGAIAFSDYPRLQFHLNRYYKKKEVKHAIGRMRQHGGVYTFTSDAIHYMRTRAFREDKGARENVTRIGIIITDGRSYDTEITAAEAELARHDGIHLFAIGVGKRVDQNELEAIASEPSDYYSFMVENYDGLKRIKELLAKKACTVTDPPTTTTTTTTTPIPTTTTTTTTPKPESITQPSLRFEPWTDLVQLPPFDLNLLPEEQVERGTETMQPPGVDPDREDYQGHGSEVLIGENGDETFVVDSGQYGTGGNRTGGDSDISLGGPNGAGPHSGSQGPGSPGWDPNVPGGPTWVDHASGNLPGTGGQLPGIGDTINKQPGQPGTWRPNGDGSNPGYQDPNQGGIGGAGPGNLGPNGGPGDGSNNGGPNGWWPNQGDPNPGGPGNGEAEWPEGHGPGSTRPNGPNGAGQGYVDENGRWVSGGGNRPEVPNGWWPNGGGPNGGGSGGPNDGNTNGRGPNGAGQPGYVDQNGNWVPGTGENKPGAPNGWWPNGGGPGSPNGGGPNGAGQPGYVDKNGHWWPTGSGPSGPNGGGPNGAGQPGYIDENGRWWPTGGGPSGPNGGGPNGAGQPGYVDENGRWWPNGGGPGSPNGGGPNGGGPQGWWPNGGQPSNQGPGWNQNGHGETHPGSSGQGRPCPTCPQGGDTSGNHTGSGSKRNSTGTNPARPCPTCKRGTETHNVGRGAPCPGCDKRGGNGNTDPGAVENEATHKGRRQHENENEVYPSYGGTTYTGSGCTPDIPTDVVFVVDSKTGGDSYQRHLWNFIKDIVARLNMDADLFRIQFVHECVSVPDLRLSSFTDKPKLLRELQNIIEMPRRTASLFRSMSGKIASVQQPFQDRRKVGVYVTDDHSQDLEDTLLAAQEAKEQFGVELFGVGVGGAINPDELRTVASSNDRSHVYMMSHHAKLPHVAKKLSRQLCIQHKSRKRRRR